MAYNLGVFIPNMTDATSFYRGIGPLAQLRTVDKNLNYAFIQNVNWSTLKLVDAVFMQRPYTADHLKIAELVKIQNKPLWIDFDDYLFDVPASNPAHKVYMDPKTQKNIASIIAMADVVTVSTEKLRSLLEKINSNIVVIPNALDDTIAKLSTDLPPPNKIIMWRGSDTHRADLNLIAKACVSLSKKYPEWIWNFVGCAPWFMDFMQEKTAVCTPMMDIMEYFQYLHKVNPAMLLVPLDRSEFNEAKSACSWLEGTYSGAVTVAPDFHFEFAKPGVQFYDHTKPESITNTIERLIQTSPAQLSHYRNQSTEYINNNLLLSEVNKKRMKVLHTLKGEL